MQEETESKINNGKEILQHIKEIKADYEATPEDIVEEEMSFLDRLNRLVQLVLNDEAFSIYTALDKQSMDQWKKKKFSRWLKKTIVKNYKNSFYFLFLACITTFLVSEAANFYSEGNVTDLKAYVKAILTELSFIFLNGFRAADLIQKVWVGLLRAGIFSLMLFAISSQTFMNGTLFQASSSAIQEQVVILEKQITEKEKSIDFYVNKGWGNNVKRLTTEKDRLVTKLLDLKDKQAQGSNEKVSNLVVYKSYGQAFFRVLLLLISVLITRRLFSF